MLIKYIYDGGDLGNRVLMGIDHKVLSQVNSFKKAGFECELICPKRKGMIATLLQCIPFVPDRTIWSTALTDKADALYIRRPVYISRDFLAALKRYKQDNPGLRILFEVPTWPYDKEMENLRYGLVLLKDRINRKQLNGLVDAIVDLSGTDKIFGIKTVQIQNGIDLDAVRERKASINSSTINLVFVALFSKWHGADRLIEGLRHYYSSGGKRNIVAHFVGEGPAFKSLVDLVSHYSLEPHVEFHGNCTRAQMDSIYDKCAFGIASLGLHRIGLESASTLKTREYLAKGLPFAFSGRIKEFEDDPVHFCLQLPSDESPVNIEQLISFFDSLYSECTEEEHIQQIRGYANKHVGMLQTMKPVFDFIRNGVSD